MSDEPQTPPASSDSSAPVALGSRGEGSSEATRSSSPLLELGPLLIFFGVNWWKGIIPATGAFMVAILLSTAYTWKRHGRVPPMMIVTAVAVLIFGGLTIWLEDAIFIKLKVTIINALFAGALTFGLLTGRNFLRVVFGHAFRLSDAGWRKLTVRYIAFFAFLAVLNEVVWRSVSDDMWVKFKVFGLLGMTLLFTIVQVPLLQKHQLEGQET